MVNPMMAQAGIQLLNSEAGQYGIKKTVNVAESTLSIVAGGIWFFLNVMVVIGVFIYFGKHLTKYRELKYELEILQ